MILSREDALSLDVGDAGTIHRGVASIVAAHVASWAETDVSKCGRREYVRLTATPRYIGAAQRRFLGGASCGKRILSAHETIQAAAYRVTYSRTKKSSH